MFDDAHWETGLKHRFADAVGVVSAPIDVLVVLVDRRTVARPPGTAG